MKMKKKVVSALFALILIFLPWQFPMGAKAAAGSIVNVLEESDEDILNWNSAPERIQEAILAGGRRNVDVITGYEMEVSDAILKQLAGKEVTLAMQTGTGISISLSGTDIQRADGQLQITLSEEDVIPESISSRVTESSVMTRAFSMAEKEAYPFRMNVHMDMGRENAGKPVLLYYYDEEDNVMRLTGIFQITQSGYAMFGLNRGDEYLAVVPYGRAYYVAEGDILGRIAGRAGVTLRTLMNGNPQLSDADTIYPGQMIIVP